MKVTNIETAFIERSLSRAGLPFSKGKPPDKTLINLANAKQRSHAKFLRQMKIAFDVTAPLYWFSEFDTYRIGVTRMSDSTMHTLLNRELSPNDFLHTVDNDLTYTFVMKAIQGINAIREKENWDNNTKLISIKKILPSSFKYTSFITMNYEVLRTIYHDRINHRLPEWQMFLNSFRDIPYFQEFIVGGEK